MAPNPLQLAGIGVAALAVVLAITATATKGWLVLSVSAQAITVKSEMGLFTSCVYRNGEEFLCQDLVDTGDPSSAIVCGSHTVGDTNAYVRAMQAMSILSILVGAAAVGLAAAKATVLPIKLPVDAGLSCLAAAIAFVTFVLFAVFYGTWLQCGTSMCDGACNGMNDCSCGLNYSFALSVVSFVLFAVGGVLMFLGPRAHPVMGSEERDNSASSYHAYDKAT